MLLNHKEFRIAGEDPAIASVAPVVVVGQGAANGCWLWLVVSHLPNHFRCGGESQGMAEVPIGHG
jgi:hypothetical protein